jgi:hypothetical protein
MPLHLSTAFLAEPQARQFSFQVNQLVKVQSVVRTQPLHLPLLKTLAKVELSFIHNQLEIADLVTWMSISINQQIATKISSTTNSLEPRNRHLYEKTVRIHSFKVSLFLLAEIMFPKLCTFPQPSDVGFR